MDTNQPPAYSTSSMPPSLPSSRNSVFGTKIPSGVAFAVGILLFLLPFAEVHCNGRPFAKNTGLGIAMGTEWKSTDTFFGENNKNSKNDGNQKNDPNPYAIIALILAVTGLALSMTNARAAIGGAILSGVLSSASLIGLMLDLQRQAKDPNPLKNNLGGELDNTMNDIKVSIEFTPWYYIAVVSFLAAAFFCYKRMKAIKQ